MANAPIITPSGGGGASIGGAVTGGTAKSVLFIDASGNLDQDNAQFAWDNANDILNIGAHATPPTHPGVLNIAGAGTLYSAIDLVGKAQDGSTDTDGMRIVMYNNGPSNRQMLFTDSSWPVSNDTSTHCALRIVIAANGANIDCGSTDVSAGATLGLGRTDGTTQIFGTGVSVNASGANPSASAMLDIASTTKGLLPPRMTTTQKNAISSPAEGLQVHDSTLHLPQWYNGSAWIGPGGSAFVPQILFAKSTSAANPASTSYVAVGPSQAITLQSSTNKVRIDVVIPGYIASASVEMDFTILKDGTALDATHPMYIVQNNGGSGFVTVVFDWVDAPGDTSSHTYQAAVKAPSGTAFNYLLVGGVGSITLTEVNQ